MGTRGVRLDGSKLTLLYQGKGWSQQDLAHWSGLDARTITKIKRGGPCDASSHLCLALALNVPPEDLLLRSAPPATPTDHDDSVATTDGAATAPSSSGSAVKTPGAEPAIKNRFLLEEVWKIVDLRQAHTPGTTGEVGVVVSDFARVKKLDAGEGDLVFPYLTWGDRIECLSHPIESQWERITVRPGDLAHSDKQWEMRYKTPPGPPGTAFTAGPSQFLFVNAFHGEGQSWWQTRVAYPTESLTIQILFSLDHPCDEIVGSIAPPGQPQFEPALGAPPILLPDGAIAWWHINGPAQGAFYKLSWKWRPPAAKTNCATGSARALAPPAAKGPTGDAASARSARKASRNKSR